MNSPHPRNVFLKVKVPFDKMTAFKELHKRLFSEKQPLQSQLCGYSKESEKHGFILSITLTGDAPTAVANLNSVILGMIENDYYPCFSEQPSDAQRARAAEFSSSLQSAPAASISKSAASSFSRIAANA